MLEEADRNNLMAKLKTEPVLKVLTYDEAIELLLLDSIDRYIESRILADKTLEGLLRDILGGLDELNGNVVDLLKK